MIKISPLSDLTKTEFETLFSSYYKELGCEDDTAHLTEEYILPDLLAGLISIDILRDGETYTGFVIYQIDDIENEWNFKEGWGDIRELYIIPSHRRQGLGKFLLYTAEMKLREKGANKSYCLPVEGSESFFTACGYSRTDDYSAELDSIVYEKSDLSNKCK